MPPKVIDEVKSLPEEVLLILENIFLHDSRLKSHQKFFKNRITKYLEWKKTLNDNEGGLESFSLGYQQFGVFQREHGVEVKEWAPNAERMALAGQFNNWNTSSHQLSRDSFAKWHLYLQNVDVPHNSPLKLVLWTRDGQQLWRLPSWTRQVVFSQIQNQNDRVMVADAVFYAPKAPYLFRHVKPKRPVNLKIYEVHGICTNAPRFATFLDVKTLLLPRIRDLGYNTVMLIGIAEHFDYSSVGKQPTNPFAPSSRFGNPEMLKELVDAAHGLGLLVLMEIFHCGSAADADHGIWNFDGTQEHLFHQIRTIQLNPKEDRLAAYNYGNYETMRYLLSNARYWMEEYQLDGLRFAGVTSMLYPSRYTHGISQTWSSSSFFGQNVDVDAAVYLSLVNDLIHSQFPGSITIADDCSATPTLCLAAEKGGLGFDYRMGHEVPDMWTRLVRELEPEEWPIQDMLRVLSQKLPGDSRIFTVERYFDQMFGNRPLAADLFGLNRDWDEDEDTLRSDDTTFTVERGIGLHKMMRMLTFTMCPQAYSNFMCNEFGHPNGIEFNLGSNLWNSRRQWNLVDDPLLRCIELNMFDKALMKLEMTNDSCEHLLSDEQDQIIAFAKGHFILVFNFSNQPFDLRIPSDSYCHVILSTDEPEFGGQARICHGQQVREVDIGIMQLTLPHYTACILKQQLP